MRIFRGFRLGLPFGITSNRSYGAVILMESRNAAFGITSDRVFDPVSPNAQIP